MGALFACIRAGDQYQAQLWDKAVLESCNMRSQEKQHCLLEEQRACVKALHYQTGKEVRILHFMTCLVGEAVAARHLTAS